MAIWGAPVMGHASRHARQPMSEHVYVADLLGVDQTQCVVDCEYVDEAGYAYIAFACGSHSVS